MKKSQSLKVGTKIEMEHTKSKKTARKIASDHIKEMGPDYYDNKIGLPAMERKLKKKRK
jgi:hypothetical protein